jgi:RimJ/RimL family protein N-acetyltransferase
MEQNKNKIIKDIPNLESDRLVLEPLSLKFLSQRYVDWMNDELVNLYLESGGDYTFNKLKSYLLNVETSTMYFWAIKIKDTNEHIGNIKIDPINSKHLFGEYGILIGDRTSWGKGFAKEASKLVLDYCFSTIHLRKINLGVLSTNHKAIALYKKLGFTQEGCFKSHSYFKGVYVDSIRMAIFNPLLS